MSVPSITLAAQVCWTAPTEREDNTALPANEIAGYQISKGGGAAWKYVNAPATCADLLATDTDQQGYIQTVDTDGRQSVPSATFTVLALQKANPKPPITIIVST